LELKGRGTENRARWGLAVILLGYLLAGIAFAVFTPAWQAPDEPAHFNYVRCLAEGKGLPILLPGDYPHQYLEEIKARRFPPDMPIAPLRYEFHQPPLYYLLATPVYLLFRGTLLPLRLLSVGLGGLLLLAIWRLLWMAFPGREGLALATVAFVAFLPMHVAFSAAVNNDVLAELWLVLGVWGLLRYLRDGQDSEVPVSPLLRTGVVIGLGLLTKTTAYILLPLALAAVVLRQGWLVRGDGSPGDVNRRVAAALRQAAALLGPAILLGALWWGRNLWLYGGVDLLGLGRHDAIVVGQPRTAEWLASLGGLELARRFLVTTFHSFWGQFGWMGVPLDGRLYAALAVLSLAVGLGFGAFAWRVRGACAQKRREAAALGLMALWGLITLGTYLWYNRGFVQHQGRYLFPALVPLGLAFALGWRELGRAWVARLVAGFLALVALALLAWDFLGGAPDKWGVVLLLGGAVGLVGLSVLPAWGRHALYWTLYAALWALDFVCLFGFVVPALGGHG